MVNKGRWCSVLWQKPLHQQKNPTRNATTQKRHKKRRLHNECIEKKKNLPISLATLSQTNCLFSEQFWIPYVLLVGLYTPQPSLDPSTCILSTLLLLQSDHRKFWWCLCNPVQAFSLKFRRLWNIYLTSEM